MKFIKLIIYLIIPIVIFFICNFYFDFRNSRELKKIDNCKRNIKILYEAIKKYAISNNNRLPENLKPILKFNNISEDDENIQCTVHRKPFEFESIREFNSGTKKVILHCPHPHILSNGLKLRISLSPNYDAYTEIMPFGYNSETKEHEFILENEENKVPDE